MERLLLDNHKLLYHLEPLSKWLNGEDIYPVYCAVSLTPLCNNRCVFCVYDSFKREKIFLDKDKFLAGIKELAPKGLKAVFFSGEGEPLLHPQLAEIIEGVKSCGIDCALNTNGVLLTEGFAKGVLKDLTFIRVSLNAGSPENYEQIHRSSINDYKKVLENLGTVMEIKHNQKLSVTVGVQCILLGENIKYIKNLTSDLKKIGIDYLAFKPFLPIDIAKYRTKLNLCSDMVKESLQKCVGMSNDSFKVVVRWESFSRLEKRTYDKCLSLPFIVEIDSKGDVYPCGVFLGRKEYCYGSIYAQSFQKLKQSEQYKNVIKKMTTQLNVHQCMPNCRNDAVNRFLWSLKHPPEHVNFI